MFPVNAEVNGIDLDSGQVECDDVLITFPPGIHRHGCGMGHGAQYLFGEAVQLTEWIEHQHDMPP
jgi:hypothetical protein